MDSVFRSSELESCSEFFHWELKVQKDPSGWKKVPG